MGVENIWIHAKSLGITSDRCEQITNRVVKMIEDLSPDRGTSAIPTIMLEFCQGTKEANLFCFAITEILSMKGGESETHHSWKMFGLQIAHSSLRAKRGECIENLEFDDFAKICNEMDGIRDEQIEWMISELGSLRGAPITNQIAEPQNPPNSGSKLFQPILLGVVTVAAYMLAKIIFKGF